MRMSIPFDSNNLFPLLKDDQKSYTLEQLHSQQVDNFLNIRTDKTEGYISVNYRGIQKQNKQGMPIQYWIDLPIEALLTPYTEIREILEQLKPQNNQHIIDLGAGYGRMGFVMHKHFPDTLFTGFEVIAERVLEGQTALKRFGCKNANLIHQDLAAPSFILPKADYYFIYDFGSKQSVQKTLLDLQKIAQSNPIVVVGRGRLSRDLIEQNHPWLSQVQKPIHTERYSIYKSH